MALRLAFMGTPGFSVAPLAQLISAGHDIAAVYSQPPRPAGRGHTERKSEVHVFAEANGIPVRTPKSLRNAEEQAAFAALDLDVAVVVAYGLILPKPILDAPRLGCINIHASLLPRWRGAAPIQRAIMAGDAETGVMVMQMEEGLDTGPVGMAERVAIGPAQRIVRHVGGVETDPTTDQVVKRDLAIRHLEPCDRRASLCLEGSHLLSSQGPAEPVIAHHLGATGLASGLHLVRCAVALVGVGRLLQLGQRVGVNLAALALQIRPMRTADFGTLVPVESQPAHHFEDGVIGLLAVAGQVGVFDAEDEGAAVVPGKGPVEQRGAGHADVGTAGRRRTEADANGCAR